MNNRKETSTAPISQIDYNDIAKAVAGVLSGAPMTAAEINAALGTDYEALQVSNAVQSIPGIAVCKATRTVVNRRGETVEKTYTAYFLK